MPDGVARSSSSRILLTADAVGGVWQYATDLAAALLRRGVEPVVAVMGPAPAPSGPSGIRVIETGLPLDWTAADEAELDGGIAALRSLAEQLAVDSVHLHAPGLVGDAPWHAPVVAVAHSCVATWWDAVKGGDMPSDLQWRRDRTAAGMHAADRVVAPTHAFADALSRTYGPGNVTVVHNGRAAHAAVSPAPEGHVLTAGRLWDEGKNLPALDRAAAHLPIRAAGPVEGPGVSARFDHLRLLGTLSAAELAAERARASVFASVPFYEPFGLAVLEAAQAGLPLVLSDIATLRELWDGAALFVPPGDDLVPPLRHVLQRPGDLGARARARAARYTVDAMADGTLALHRSLLQAC